MLTLLPVCALLTLAIAHGQEVRATDPTAQIKVDAVEPANGQDGSLESAGLENSLEVGPITGEDAAMDGLATAELALDSQDELRSVIPQAFLFKIAAGTTYNSNILQSEFNEESDMILQYGLGVTFQSTKGGNTAFAFNYEAGAFNYLDHSDLNGINHAVGLKAGLSLPKTTLGLSAAYQHIETGDQLPRQVGLVSGSGLSDGDASDSASRQVSQANREVGLFNTRDVLAAALTASRNVAPKTNLVSSVNYSANLYEDDRYQSTQDLAAQFGITYQFTGKTTLGLAGGIGYLDNGANGEQTYQQLLVTAAYNASGKLVLRGSSGVEFRQYGNPESADDGPASTGTDDATLPVFNFAATYQIRVRTAVTLSASRDSDGSAFSGVTSVERTNLALGLDQTLGNRFKLGLAGGYELTDYNSSAATFLEREEKYWFARSTFNFAPSTRSSVGVFYELRNNDSGGSGLTYEANRVGVQCAINF